MVARPEDYEYSGHRSYLGLDTSGLVDAEPVLRHFGANKRKAVEVYTRFVNAALGQQSQSEYYLAAEGRTLGNDEFLHEVKHRIGDYVLSRDKRVRKADMEGIVKAAEKATGLERKNLCSNSKNRLLVLCESVKSASSAVYEFERIPLLVPDRPRKTLFRRFAPILRRSLATCLLQATRGWRSDRLLV